MTEQQGSIFNFLKMVEQGEVESMLPQPAPFGLKDADSSHKITFLKARAKNFRSIGSDFMELDFIRNKSTLIVSDDNGAGKSTMCIWCPYYAMFGKPYSPKEKMAGLINSSTRKDCLVELEFTTKGKYWMVRRGQKPTVFEILYRNSDDQEWIKEESEAALRDQQKYLESLLGFDAKIAENVIILGADKFVPFIEMDAPSRRHVVETIWDLAIFPTMLKVAKEDWAVNNVRSGNLSVEIDKTNSNIDHTSEMLESVNAEIPRLEVLKQNASDYETTASNLSVEANTLKENDALKQVEYSTQNEELSRQRAIIELEVNAEYGPKIAQFTRDRDDKRNSIDGAVKEIETEYEPKIAQIKEEHEQLLVEKVSKLESLKDSYAEIYAGLNERLKQADNTANEAAEQIQSERKLEEPVPDQETLDSTLASIERLEIDIVGINVELDKSSAYASTLTTKNLDWSITKNSLESELVHLSDKKQTLINQIEEFEHMGVCPTCSQRISAEAIGMLKQRLQDDFDEIEKLTADLTGRINHVSEQIEKLNQGAKHNDQHIRDLNLFKTEKESQISTYQDIYDGVKKEHESLLVEFNRETDRLITEKRAEIVHGINSEIQSFKSESMLELNKKKSAFDGLIRESEGKLRTIEVERDNDVKDTRHYIENQVNQIELKLSVINAEYQRVLTDKTSALTQQITELEAEFKEYTNSVQHRIKRALADCEEALKKRDEMMKEYRSQYDDCVMRQRSLIDKKQILQETLKVQSEEFELLNKRMDAYKFLITELGDKAAKAEIIKAYLPYFNSKVNEYLEAMNLFVGFKIDENFDVEFTAPDRRGQSTFSLSKGQLTRLNLAVMFSLRDIANLKSSVASSLLVLDESLEALSERGVREVTEMMNQRFQHMNVFVVSQRATEFDEYFTSSIRYGLRGGFTEII